MKFGVSILAAGQGTRLKLELPKPLAPVLGRALVDFSIDAVFELFKDCQVEGNVGVVVGHGREHVESHIQGRHPARKSHISFAFQEKQLGTADALRAYFKHCSWASKTEFTLVICADTPLIRGHDLAKLYRVLEGEKREAVAATFTTKTPYGYGRIVRGNKGFHIVEEKDATDEQRSIEEVNAGLYIVKTSYILEKLASVDSNNKSGEFYLTDIFSQGENVRPVQFDDEDKFLGVNDLVQLEKATTLLRKEKNQALMKAGVRFISADSCVIDWDVRVGEGTLIYPNVIVEGNSKIGNRAIIGAGSIIKNTLIEDATEIKAYGHFEEAVVRAKASVGPFARLRPQADIGSGAKIGNFVEIKKSTIHTEAKVSHLSYVGDAEIGARSNIGCGFVTCNYDGKNKYKTIIGEDTFIGSDSQTVAPVRIGDKCFVGSGSTITDDMPDGSLAIARSRQVTKNGGASKYIDK